MEAPTIHQDAFMMRAFKPEDAEGLHAILGDPEVIRYFPFKHTPTLEQTQRMVQHQIQHWQERNYGWWALENPINATLIGWCGLEYLPELGETEVGYLLRHDYWGRGIATVSAQEALHFAFENVLLDHIIALVHPENKASVHVLEKLGMQFLQQVNLWEMDMLKYSIGKVKFQELQAATSP
jgi:ribosomal-protein-alanine N-acetyltransferase